MRIVKGIFYCFILFCVSFLAMAEDKGDFYFKRFIQARMDADYDASRAYLKKAVDNGSVRAMCYYARENMEGAWKLGEESTKYYQIAMNKKEPCGYFALMNTGSNPLWNVHQAVTDEADQVKLLAEVRQILAERIKNGDINLSTYYYYLAKGESAKEDALLAASKLGNSWASFTYAEGIRDGDYGWFLTKNNRMNEAIRWYEKSIEQGDIDSYNDIADIYIQLHQYNKMEEVLLNGIENNSASAMDKLAIFYRSYKKDEDSKNVLKINDKKAYEYYYILSHQLPVYFRVKRPDGSTSLIGESIEKIKQKLTAEQIAEAEKNAKEWMKTHRVHFWFNDIQ
jgi:alkylated DNA nucleotide flippase Atl1